MIIGARTHDFGKKEGLTLTETFRQIRQIGYRTIQLAPAKSMPEIADIHSITEAHIEKIRAALKETDMTVAVLGCYIEPSIADKEARMRSVETFKKNLHYAKLLGAPVVGTETTHFPQADCASRQEAYGYLKDSVRRMAETAEREGVYVGVEPVAGQTLNTPELARQLLDEVGSDYVKIILDPANLLSPATVDRQQDIFGRAIELLGADIAAVHIKNFTTQDDRQKMCALADGVVDFGEIFRWLRVHKPDLAVLRENSTRQTDAADIAYIRGLISA